MKFFSALLCIFLSINAFAQTSKEASVWAKVDALNKAVFNTKDSIEIKKLVSDKLTYGHSGGNLEDKRTMVTNASNSKTVYKNFTVEKLSATVVKKTATARFILRATSVDKGVESPLNIGILTCWIKEHGDWKLLARQAVKVNPK